MRKTILSVVCLVSFLASRGQDSTSLFQNFDASCASSTGFPTGWDIYNIIPATVPLGQWTCAPGQGEDGGACVTCTGDYSGGYNADTSFLITPELDLSSYTGEVYLQFDTKSTFISGEKLGVYESVYDTGWAVPAEVSSLTLTPVIGPGDSTGWVTHQVNLTPYKSAPFYVAFRYSSNNTIGTKWYIDNVLTTTVPLGINDPQKQNISLSVIGTPSTSQIKITYGPAAAGTYDLVLYNMMGQVMSRQALDVPPGTTVYTLDNLTLCPGMYFIRMGNGSSYGVVKAVVR